MSPRRKVRASELAEKNKDTTLLRYFVLLIVVGGFFLYYMVKWTSDEDFDRFRKAREYSQYYKEFFVEAPLYFKVFDEMTLVIRATNLGSEFWNKEFRQMLVQSENEVNELLKVAELINETHNVDGVVQKTEQNLSSFPEIYDILKTGNELSQKTLFNQGAGEIFEFWARQQRNYKRRVAAYSKAETIAGYLFDNPMLSPLEIKNRKKLLENLTKEKADANVSTEQLIKDINKYSDEGFKTLIKNATERPSSLSEAEKKALLINIFRHIKMHSQTTVSPDLNNLKEFIPFAKSENIVFDEATKSVKISSPNTSAVFNFFREALFLRKLVEKLPQDDFNYLIFLGDRHGAWKLPEEYIRWTISIDDPYAITSKLRGALKLMPEKGFFVVTRKNEEVMLIKMGELTDKIRKDFEKIKENDKRNEYITELKKEYSSRRYFFDPVKITMFQRFDTPVDWRTGEPSFKNMSATVIDSDPVKARMLSYSLFISGEEEIRVFEKEFPETVFGILNNDGSVYVPEKIKSLYMTVEEIKKAKVQEEFRARGLNADGSVPEK